MGYYRSILRGAATTAAFASGLAGCSDDGAPNPFDTAGAGSTDTAPLTTSAATNPDPEGTAGLDSTASSTDPDPSSGNGGDIFDVGSDETGPGGDCEAAAHVPCDAGTDDPFMAMGLGCPGETAITGTVTAHPDGIAVLSSWGQNSTFDPTEGESYLVISTGDLAERNNEPVNAGDAANHCNSWFSPGDGMSTTSFPPPITTDTVAGDCLTNPALVGTGDCSNTVGPQFDASGFKYDYQEVRLTMVVPEDAQSLSFNVAFLTKEYPIFLGQPYNDMAVAWLESSTWTGNISFDNAGNALSLNAALLDLFDDDGTLDEFAGTCMRYSAGTPWLTTTVDVPPGEEIELVFAIFDLDDVNWDSFMFLDNFQWGCGDVVGPTTEPAG